MIQSKNLAIVLALVGLLTTSGIANADAKFYMEVGGVMGDPSDASAEFTTENTGAAWGFDDMLGAKLQFGGDFGHVRTDVKMRYLEGGIDSISGGVSGITDDEVHIGVATVNVYFDIYDFKAEGSEVGVTPYVGIGVGYAAGFMEADGTLGGVVRTDHRNDRGSALSGVIGALFSATDNIGLTAEYERLDTGVGGVDANNYSLGLRLTF